MSSPDADTSPQFFDEMYQGADDPWNFLESPYEQSRYQAILEALGKGRFGVVFEPGCSIGALSQMLARQSNQLIAMDCSQAAVRQARVNCSALANIEFRVGSLPHHCPEQSFDAIVFSEMGYYFDPEALSTLAEILWDRLVPNGIIVACHWLGHSADHRISGELVADTLSVAMPEDCSFESTLHHQFIIQKWRKT